MKKMYNEATHRFEWHLDAWHQKTALVVGYVFGTLFAIGFVVGFVEGLVE